MFDKLSGEELWMGWRTCVAESREVLSGWSSDWAVSVMWWSFECLQKWVVWNKIGDFGCVSSDNENVELAK